MRSQIQLAAALMLLAAMPAAFAQQKAFAFPEAAMNAFGDAVATNDEDAMKELLGADFRMLIPPTGAEARLRFLAAWAKSHALKAEGDAKALISVGESKADAALDAAELAAWTLVCNELLNLDEALNK